MTLWIVVTLAGCLLGRLSAGWAASSLHDMNSGGLYSCPQCGRLVPWPKRWFSFLPVRCNCGAPPVRWHLMSAAGLGTIFLCFAVLLLNLNCQSVHEVQPAGPMWQHRLPFHLTLIFFLWTATTTDLLDYVIPEDVIGAGVLIGLISAAASGQLQMIHIWVNWDSAIEGLKGPYLPDWMKHHQHLHGLAWSLAGAACGVTLTWTVRAVSHLLLGQPALGFGDVLLMALVGTYIGWQPTLCVLAIAPMLALVVGLVVRLTTGRSFVAFGPYLALATLVVICTWRWLWQDTLKLRDIFSHWPTVAGLVGGSLAGLTVLLLGLRLFWSLPASRLRN